MTAATSRTQTSTSPLASPAPLASRTPGAAGNDFAALLARQAEPGASGAARLGDTQARMRAAARAADAGAPESRPQPALAPQNEAPRTPQAKAPAAQPARPPAASPANADKNAPADASARHAATDADAAHQGKADPADDSTETQTSDADAKATRDDGKPGDAVLAAWFQWPGASRAEPADTAEGRGGDAALAGTSDPGTDARAAGRSTDDLQAQAATDAQAASPRADTPAAPADGAFAAALLGASDAGLRSESSRRSVSSIDAPHGASIAGLGAPAQPAQAPASAAASAPPSIPLGTAPGQPDFAETVSMHLSQLAKDGQHEATLTLNPAELGSIAVRIALDGNQTQVDFSASSANTRDLLQAHLGDLARALQDAGLQMTGGGVRDQAFGAPQDGRPGTSGRSSRIGGVEAAAPSELARVRVPVATAGRLDLFA